MNLQYSKKVRGPFAAEIKQLQQKISALARREQDWIEKVQKQRGLCKTVRGRIKLLRNKRRLQARIDTLNERLRLERARGIKGELRATLKSKVSENEALENMVQILQEDLKRHEGFFGAEWVEQMLKKNRVQQSPYPDEYVAHAIDIMAQCDVLASKMPRVMETTYEMWTSKSSDGVAFGSARQHQRWREAIPYLCLIHIGFLMTRYCENTTVTQVCVLLQLFSPRARCM